MKGLLGCVVFAGQAEDTFSDVTFVAEGREFMAHCAIIAQRCPKLKDAINHSGERAVRPVSQS